MDDTIGPAPMKWIEPQKVRSVPVREVPGKSATPPTQRVVTGDPKVTWPSAGAAEVDLTSRAAAVGTLPVAVATPAAGAGAAQRSAAGDKPPQRVQVSVRDRAAAAKAGVDGLVLTARRADGRAEAAPVKISVDYSSFRHAFGGDWASRLRLVPLDGAAAPTAMRNDVIAGQVSARVTVSGADATYALTAGPAGDAGDYTATSLSPESRWQVSTSSGAFAWTYPMPVPPVPGGLVPEIAASYNSQAVDGRVAARNNQPSWLGEGWNLGEAFVERSYKACADDMGSGANNTEKTGDLCWETQNATMSFGSRSGRLVALDADGDTWRLMDDDGTRIERLTGAVNGDDNGERWVLTATDGTQYHFGLNRLPGWASGKPETRSVWTVPVYANEASDPAGTGYDAGDFAKSKKDKQAYRWNLDWVVDPNGNAMSYYYATESNKYGANLGRSVVDYVRGGWLERIEYGLRSTNAYAAEPAQVVFSVADRCVPGSSSCAKTNKPAWPDVPWDQECTAAPCAGKYSPTFWSSKRLTTVTTRILPSTGDYVPVDRWNAQHSFPSPEDGTTAALWLTQIQHTGASGGEASLPAVKFVGDRFENRVNWETDGKPKLNKFRIISIRSESGGKTDVKYSAPECGTTVAEGNIKRCFPVRWAMPPEEPENDWFRKYVVEQTVEGDNVLGAGARSPDIVTSYTYVGGAAWAYNNDPLVPATRRTWDQWRGYEKVEVRKGDPGGQRSLTSYLYFRGMGGDVKDSTGTEVTDAEPLAGFLREEITYNGDGGSEVEGEIHTPWKRSVATQGPFTAYQVENSRTVTRTRLSSGTYRSTRVDTTHDHYGNPIEVDDHGDTAVSGDERCTTTEYAQDAARWMMDLPKQTTTVAVDCDRTPTLPADAIADEQATYDGAGNLAKTEVVSGYTGGEPTWLTTATSKYDMYGRVTETTDSLERTSKTAYTETRGLTTRTVATNALDHTTTTDIDPARGVAVKTTDVNGRSTSVKHDPLGRVTEVWKPGLEKDKPVLSAKYAYAVRNADGPSWVRTETLAASGDYVVSYQLLDGLLRPRQTQAPSPVGTGRIITDTLYDARGLVNRTHAAYYNVDAAPGTTFVVPNAGDVPSATVKVYDGAERETDSIHMDRNTERWRTRTYHGGDHTSVVPPEGGTATSTHVDARGRTVKLVQYETRPSSGAPTGAGNTTRYTHNAADALETVTDATGNVWRYEYDILGRNTRVDDPDKGESRMTYDNAGQLLTITDARGKTIASSYDALGRLTETRLGSATGTLLTKRVYDTLTEGKGLLTSSTRYVGGSEYIRQVTGYDVAGRPTGDETVIPDTESGVKGTYKETFEYLADGSLKKRILPKLDSVLPVETLNFTYTADLGLRNSVLGWKTYVNETKYNELGEVAQVWMDSVASGKRLTFTPTYESDTRRLVETVVHREEPESPFVNDQKYQYDHVGNVRSIADRTTGQANDTQCFAYDHLRRMTSAWTAKEDCTVAPSTSTVDGPAPYWHTYSYDAIGNRTKLQRHGLGGAADVTSTYKYPAPGAGVDRPHAVTSVDTGSTRATYGYDAAGNMTSRPGPTGAQTLAWDDEGRLSSIASGAESTGYIYDADGAVLIRRDPGKVTLFLASGEVTVDTATGNKRGTRVYDGIGVRSGGVFTWTVADRHGTNTLAISSKLEVTARRSDPFGNARGTNPAWPAGNRGFVGGSDNPGTGLVRLGAREYDPLLGRFISVDPIIDPDDPQQMNAYAYSNNNPATMSDPDGLRFSCPDGDCGGHRGPSANKKGKKHTAAKAPGTTYSKKMYQIYKKKRYAGTTKKRMPSRILNDERLWQRTAKEKAHRTPKVPSGDPHYHFIFPLFHMGPNPTVGEDGFPVYLLPLMAGADKAMKELHRCFNCNFPIPGAPKRFPAHGEHLPLKVAGIVPAPLESYPLETGDGMYYHVSGDGHFDGRGSVIHFRMQQDGKGQLQLHVRGYVVDPKVPTAVSTPLAYAEWSKFAGKLGHNIAQHQCNFSPTC
ncbi:type IV secretion protein Rhs [Micromonospora andamanensis]|uniref:Type IV secretion protein Rhs n=1 Tax=Micromonospora andamanensis TaxID=1287068 RepID=A0ABQ4I3N5_9ACTN|nr:type IV secretion protein Rhs [Micromonospora andamanensis]